jgi:transposase InsO family protein
MSAATSASTGQVYGVKRVCTAWELARSSYYAWRTEREAGTGKASATVSGASKRGPAPAVSDGKLLAAIRHDLERSPFTGEGHRKVWARLRIVDKICVSRKRVLRLMREHRLLSPHRPRTPREASHPGTISTEAPNVMWGTDGARVFTVDDGWAWVFSAVEHWNAECVGWHVTKIGDRFAALEPIAMGLTQVFGGVEAESARGLALRMDHGTQYLSEHFLNQIKFWGIQARFAFVAQPETNGVAERFNRTLKEQIIHGRTYRNVEELRVAVRRFVELYNRQWRIEKRGYLSPIEAREQHGLRRAA